MRELISAIEEGMVEPSARGLAQAVSRRIADGTLPPGRRLPTVRSVAVELGLSPTTVSAAWNLLLRSGAIRTEGRRGTFVGERENPGSVRYQSALGGTAPLALDLASGIPDPALLPDLAPALARVTDGWTVHNYLEHPVVPELGDLLRSTWPYPVAELLVVDGALDALDQVARAVLRFGDRVAVETPCFPPVVDIVEATGVEVVGLPMDEEGLLPEALTEELTRPLRAVFVQPRGQNPTGVAWTRRRVHALAEVLAGTDTLVVEDDSAGAVSSAPDLSLGSLLPEQTVHVRSFSKSHGPDLRLAGVSAPGWLLRSLTGRRQLGQGWTSRLLQHLLLALLTDPASVAQVELARATYAERRAALVSGLAARGVTVPGTDGLNLWLPVRDEVAALVRLASQGIAVAPGAPFALTPQPPHLRVTTAGVAEDPDQVAETLAVAARTGPDGRGR